LEIEMSVQRSVQAKALVRDLMEGNGTAKALFLLAAGLSFLFSVGLWFAGDRESGLYVGLWVPSICSAGALIMARRDNG
jgi:hypothetical protein